PEGELARLLRREATRSFELTRGPLLRLCLIRLGAREHVLQWTVHHSVFDGQSTALLLSEFATLYAGGALPELSLQYADFADWQRKRTEGLSEQLAYWKRQLEGDDTLRLPSDLPRGPARSQRGARLLFPLSPASTRAARELAQRERVSVFSVLCAAYVALLARLANERDVRVGTPVTNRNRPELQPLVGNFANTVVLRAQLTDDPSFSQLLGRLQQAVQEGQQNADVPFDRVVEALNPVRELGRAPLCQVFFALQPPGSEAPRIGALESELLDLDSGAAQFDLALELVAAGEGMTGALEYDTELFDAASARRWASQYVRLLESALHAPATRCSALALADAPELERVLAFGRQRSKSARGVLARIYAQDDQAWAIEAGSERIRYGVLRQRVRALSASLQARGACAGSRVAVQMERSIDAVIALLAILDAGAAFVPIDPSYPPERVAQLSAGVALTLRAAELEAAPLAPGRTYHPELPAYVIYTSGSTGTPKGVVIPRRALDAFVDSACQLYGLEPGDRVLQFASLSFDASVEEIFPTLAAGATLVLRDEAMIADPGAFFQAADALAITVLDLPTSFWHRAVASLEVAPSAALRLVILGGEAALRERVRSFRAATKVRLVNSYGPTEATVVATAQDVADAAGSVPIGAPLPHVQALVLDAQLAPCPIGVVGDLYLAGEGLAHGYLEQPAQTARVFLPNPYASSGARMYFTGDRARWHEDGALDFVGRSDHQVKLRGYRVELGELEARAAELAREALADVRDGQLVLYAASALGADALRTHLRERLPDYMMPAQIVVLEALPTTAQGKLDRRALAALPIATKVTRGAVSERERKMCALWAQVLGRPEVGVDDNFFALGGDSISALSVVAQARAVGFALTARQLFQHQTVAELAAAAELTPVVSERYASGPLPLTPIQRWFFEHAGPNPQHWNQSMWLAPRAELDVERLERAFQLVVARHDSLRLRFRGDQQDLVDEPRVRFVRAPAVDVEALQRSLHLEHGPVLIAAWSESTHELFLTAHHLVIDGVSWRVLADELDAAYHGRELPPPSASFAQFASSQPLPFEGRPRLDFGRERDSARHMVTLAQTDGDMEPRLLAALFAALGTTCSVELEGHGRDHDTLDLSRTLGWFTTLRTIDADAPDRPRATYGEAEVALNYLGRLDADQGLFRLSERDVGAERDPDAPRSHALEVDAVIVEGELQLRFSHGPSFQDVQGLAQRMVEHLRADLADSYPLSPLQQGLLFHSLYEHDAYIEQVTCSLHGPLDMAAFRAAWTSAIARHEALRTVFLTRGEQPLQRVLPEATLELQVAQGELVDVLAADRQRGFDLEHGPLMRI
ncbi:MAG TPA: amino acid adenylation domain-containing protein, partial [Polyangiales bacterium]|nr:amino acid adenylation domain-containing protein [Polyangiales bacterium]